MAVQLLGLRTKFTDDQGRPLVGGKVHTFYAGTCHPKDTYKDPANKIPNTNPVILDDTGSADIFLDGSYLIRICDKNCRIIEEQDNVRQPVGLSDFEQFGFEISQEVNKAKLDLEKIKEKTLVVESIADLSTIKNPKDGLRVYVKSYHAGLNKGGGDFAYDASLAHVNNRGTVINGWVRQGKDTAYNVACFGAKGDGVTDDTVAIQAALDAVNISFDQDGHYIVSSTLNASRSITGNNALLDNSATADYKDGSTIIKYKNINTPWFKYVTRLRFASGNTNKTGLGEHGHHIRVISSDNILILGCDCDSPTGDGIYIGSENQEKSCTNIGIYKCRIRNPKRCGIALVSVDGCIVDDCDIDHNSYVYAIDLEPNPVANDSVNNITITNNRVKSKRCCIALTDPRRDNVPMKNILIENNKLDGGSVLTIDHSGRYENIRFNNNIISNTVNKLTDIPNINIVAKIWGYLEFKNNVDTAEQVYWRINCGSEVDLIVEDNYIKRTEPIPNTPIRGMYISGVSNFSIKNNKIKLDPSITGGTLGILLSNCTGTIDANTIYARFGVDTRLNEQADIKIVRNTFNCGEAAWIGFNGISDIYIDDTNILLNNTILCHRTSQLKQINALKAWGTNRVVMYGLSPNNLDKSTIYGKGSILYNSNPATGSYVGWSCVVEGAPGEWLGFGKIGV